MTERQAVKEIVKELEHWLTELNLDTELGLDRLKKRIKSLKRELYE